MQDRSTPSSIESDKVASSVGERLLSALLLTWSSRLHEALERAQDAFPGRPTERRRVWKAPVHTYNGFYRITPTPSFEMNRSPDEADDSEVDIVETALSHPQLEELESLLEQFDDVIRVLEGGGG